MRGALQAEEIAEAKTGNGVCESLARQGQGGGGAKRSSQKTQCCCREMH